MSFLNEVKNLHNIVRKGIRDSSLSVRMTPPRLFTKPSKIKFSEFKFFIFIAGFLIDLKLIES